MRKQEAIKDLAMNNLPIKIKVNHIANSQFKSFRVKFLGKVLVVITIDVENEAVYAKDHLGHVKRGEIFRFELDEVSFLANDAEPLVGLNDTVQTVGGQYKIIAVTDEGLVGQSIKKPDKFELISPENVKEVIEKETITKKMSDSEIVKYFEDLGYVKNGKIVYKIKKK